MLSSHLLLTILLLLWTYVLWSRRRVYKLMLQIPGPIGLPLIGSIPQFFGENALLTEFTNLTKDYGYTFLCWYGFHPVLLVANPQTAQDILTSPHSINKSNLGYNGLKKLFGNGVFVLKDLAWRTHRKALNPAFGHNILLSFLPIFNKESDLLLQEFDTLVDKKEHNLFNILNHFSFGIATQTIMGGEVTNEECYQNKSIMNSYNALNSCVTKLTVYPWFDNRLMRYLSGIQQILNTENSKCRKLIRKFIDKSLASKAEYNELNEQTNLEKNLFINIGVDLLKKNIFSYQDVEDECHTHVISAFETSSMTLGYILMLLAMFPEYQERVFDEISSAFPNTGVFDVSYEDTMKLKYLKMVIDESMRLMPAGPLIGRRIINDITLSNGVVLPKGLTVAVSIYNIHRNKDIWGPDAHIFNPDNFSPENLKDKHSHAFMPFSKGKRNCIGQKYALVVMNIALIKLLRNYKFSTSFRYMDLNIHNNVILEFKEMPCLKLEKRT